VKHSNVTIAEPDGAVDKVDNVAKAQQNALRSTAVPNSSNRSRLTVKSGAEALILTGDYSKIVDIIIGLKSKVGSIGDKSGRRGSKVYCAGCGEEKGCGCGCGCDTKVEESSADMA